MPNIKQYKFRGNIREDSMIKMYWTHLWDKEQC